MAKKPDPAQARPLTLEFLEQLGVFKGFPPPTGPFDPDGAWSNTYRLWMVQQYNSAGMLTLRRQPQGDRGVRLTVDQTILQWSGHVRFLEADLFCAADALSTPEKWSIEARCLGPDKRVFDSTVLSEKGELKGGVREVWFGKQSRQSKVPTPITSNWSLLDAVQRLDGKATRPLAFAMLDEMDLLKADQELSWRGEKVMNFGGRKVTLTGYHQIGRGVLPWQYWVNEQGRLLFAFSGVRAWIYDPAAAKALEGKIKYVRARRAGGKK